MTHANSQQALRCRRDLILQVKTKAEHAAREGNKGAGTVLKWADQILSETPLASLSV